MILPWNYEEIIINFLKDNTKVLSLGFLQDDLLLKLNHSPKLISVCSEDNDVYSKLSVIIHENINDIYNENFNIILAQYSDYQIDKIKTLLKKGGHFLTEQIGYERDINFNLENQAELFEKSGFKIVKCNQVFDDLTNQNYFYILAKKL